MRSRKIWKKRITAAGLAAVIFSLSAVPESLGAEPSVSVDETMYVTLDYYGARTDVSVVKGCFTNGVGTYTDYGDYEKIVNMTDSQEPEAGDGSVTWNFDGENKRFYYEGVMDPEQVELPWNFDTQCAEHQTDELDADGKNNVLVNDAQAPARNLNRLCDLCRVIIHQHHIGRLDRSI